jgi:hypothetical protein
MKKRATKKKVTKAKGTKRAKKRDPAAAGSLREGSPGRDRHRWGADIFAKIGTIKGESQDDPRLDKARSISIMKF